MKDFIGVYPNAFPADWCDRSVELMEAAFKLSVGTDRQAGENARKHDKDDTQIFTNQFASSGFAYDEEMTVQFNKLFWDCYQQYAKEFSVLNDFDSHTMYGQKLQKTEVGEGYHIWHCEVMNRASCNRVLAFILYLNDVEEGGETEFLYQSKRVKPEKGTLVIFPAYFTHTHRGNPPLSNTKYISTGWVEM